MDARFDPPDLREAARTVALFLGFFMIGSISITTWKVREPAPPELHGGHSLVAALRDVQRNRHARLLYAVLFVEKLGLASLAVAVPFYTNHVLEAAEYLPVFFVFFVVPGIALVPLTLRISKRIGKLSRSGGRRCARKRPAFCYLPSSARATSGSRALL